MAKVAIPAGKSYTVVKAGRSDERVGKLGLELLRQDLGSQNTCPLPVTLCDLKQRKILEQRRDPLRQLRIAQQLREDHRRQADLAIGQRLAYQLDVLAGGVGENAHPCAAIDTDHRAPPTALRWFAVSTVSLPVTN